jgi:hypothetical protein
LETILTKPRDQVAATSVALAVTKKRDMPSIKVTAEHGVQLGWMFTDRQRVQNLKHLAIL